MKTITLVECSYPLAGLYDLFYRGEPIESNTGPFTLTQSLSRAKRQGFTHYKIDPAFMLPRCTRTPIPSLSEPRQ